MAKKKAKASKKVRRRSTKIKQLKRKLTTNEFVVIRSAKTGKPRKFRGDVKVVIEVYSKKSRKRLGVLNNVENGKPVARRFSGTQFRVLTTRSSLPRIQAAPKDELGTFKVRSSSPLLEQIPTEILEKIEQAILFSDGVHLDLVVEGPLEKGFTTTIFYRTKPMRRQLKLDMVLAILESIKDLNIRISPKKFARHKKKQMRRSLKITVRLRLEV